MQLQQGVFQNDESCANQNDVEIQEYFKINDLKARLQDKDKTICKLKNTIKSLIENTKEENVNHDKWEIEPINKELENVRNYCKQTYVNSSNSRQGFCDNIIENDLRKLKGKEIVENVVHTPSATTIALGMFKLDLVPLPPRLLQNRDAHIDYLRHTQEQANTLREIVKQAKAKQPLDSELDFACKYATRIQELLVYVQDTGPKRITPSPKKVAITPRTKLKERNADQSSRSEWRDRLEIVKPFSVNVVWNCIRPRDAVVNWYDVVWFANYIPSHAFYLWLVAKGVGCEDQLEVWLPSLLWQRVSYYIWQERNLRLFINQKRSHSQVTDCIKSSLGLSSLMYLWSLKWLFPIGVIGHIPFCGSKPPGNQNNDRISQTPSRNKKNKLGNVVISRVYYVEGLGHNLFSVGQFCDADLKVAFRKNACFIRSLKGVDLLLGSRDTNLYTISLDDMLRSSPVCLLSKASKTKSWLWHRQLSQLNFACSLGNSKKSSHQPKAEDTKQEKLYLLHMDLCGPMRMASINGKRYILVIVDDYSRFTWVRFLKTKDEAPAAIIKCIKNIQVHLKATVWNVRTYNGTEFVNQTLREWYENVGITHQTSIARTP
ncbi:retrovirus-related pol polyprotein from transposon TNT 1-94 [Tanacetum coccineum]